MTSRPGPSAARRHDADSCFSSSSRVITVIAEPTSFSSSGTDVAVTTTFSEAGGTCCAPRPGKRDGRSAPPLRPPAPLAPRQGVEAEERAVPRGPRRACSRRTGSPPRSRARGRPASSGTRVPSHSAKFDVRKKRRGADRSPASGAGRTARGARRDDRREGRVDRQRIPRSPAPVPSRARVRERHRESGTATATPGQTRARVEREAPRATKLGGWGTSRDRAPRRTSRTAVVIRTSRSIRRISRAVREASRASGNSEDAPSLVRPRPRSVSSGRSPGFRILRLRAPSRTRDRLAPISRVQWFAARGVPGDSGGGRAGFSPASLGRTNSKSVEGDETIAPSPRPLQPPHRMPAACAAPTTRSTSTACGASDFPRSCSPRARPPSRSSRSAGSSRARTTCSSRGFRRRCGTRSRSRRCRAAPTTTRARARCTSRSASPCRASRATVVVVTAGTADMPSWPRRRGATLEYLGVASTLVPDVGVAGVLRLLSRLEEIERADVVIAVAGMEGSLFSVLGGLVGRPIIAVPTSRGYGAAFAGLASLLSAVNSCANGVTAVNIDSGYAAAMAAYRILSGGPRPMGSKGKGRPAQRRRVRPRRGGRRRPPPEESAPRQRDDAGKGRARRRPSRSCSTPTGEASFQARALGKAAAVFEAMLRDRQRPTILLGLAGSLIAAGMRQVIVDLIEKNMVDVVVSTGAIISQDYYQVRGGRHYHGHARRRRQGAARPLHRPALRHVHRRGEVLGDGPRGLALRRRARRQDPLLARVPRAARADGARTTRARSSAPARAAACRSSCRR